MYMPRFLLAILAAFGVAGLAFADPIKKAPAIDADKIAKECADGFIKALLEGKADAAMKFCATPFRGPDGKKLESLDEFKREVERPPSPGIEVKTGDPIELSKLNAFMKKKELKELDADTIKQYEEFMGKDGRIVLLEFKGIGAPPNGNDPPHMLVRVKDGKAHIVGVGGR